jgi:hypothetical protein
MGFSDKTNVQYHRLDLQLGFWYGAFYLMGGHALACTMFSAALVWFVGVRAFNYTGHGGGEEKHVDGVDFDRRNLSINQMRPGTVCRRVAQQPPLVSRVGKGRFFTPSTRPAMDLYF